MTLYDADQESGSFFITMELLEGLPLNRILEERGPFGPRDTARIGLQVCAGLQYAHEQSIVHRDIKTSNLFITKERVLKIMDFGLAKILEAVRDKGASVIAGTPYYMAPEQAAGKVNDGRHRPLTPWGSRSSSCRRDACPSTKAMSRPNTARPRPRTPRSASTA